MANKKINNIKLGALILLSIVLLFSGLFYVGRQENLFSNIFYLNAYFNDVKGLQEGDNVRYSGIDVGTVNDIEIISDTLVKVRFGIRKNIARFIKEDSHAEIGTEGLMGNKILIVYPGSPQSESIEENEQIPVNTTLDFDELMAELGNATNKINEITTNINKITRKLNSGYGLLGKLLNDTIIPDQMDILGDNAVEASKEIRAISAKLNRGEGDLGKLLNEDQVSKSLMGSMNKVDSLTMETKKLTERLNLIANQVVHGKGVVNKLLYDSTFAEELDQSLNKIDETVVEIEQASEAVSSSWILRLFSKKEKKNKNNEDG